MIHDFLFVRYKYTPGVLKDVLFPSSPTEDPTDLPRQKRRRLSPVDTMDIDEPSSTPTTPSESKPQRSVIVETLSESFLISPQPASRVTEDKEVLVDSDASALKVAGRRYTIALIPRKTSDAKVSSVQEQVVQSDESATTSEEVTMKPPGPQKKSTPEPGDKSTEEPKLVKDVAPPVPSASSPKEARSSAVEDKAPSGDVEMVDASALPAPGKPDETALASASTEQGKNSNVEKTSEASVEGVPSSVPEASTQPLSSTDSVKDSEKLASEAPSRPLPKAPSPSGAASPPPSSAKAKGKGKEKAQDVEELQRDLAEDNFDFTEDGVNVLGSKVENGMRRGWKIEVRSWRWAESRTVL